MRLPEAITIALDAVLKALVVVAAAGGALAATCAEARADQGTATAAEEHHVAPPPAPEEHGATLAVEVHGAAQAPLARDAICPGAAPECVFGLGLGVGAQLEWRMADRVGLFAGYDFWMLDSAGVSEVGTLHAIRGGLRYTLDDSQVVHPFLDVAVGLLAFGDTASVATAGGVVTAGGGAEFELSESVVFMSSAEVWMFATGPFETRDGFVRSADFGVNVALQLTVGIAVLVGPPVASP